MTTAIRCAQPGCTGTIAADGYCDTCGAKAPAPAARPRAAAKKAAKAPTPAPANAPANAQPPTPAKAPAPANTPANTPTGAPTPAPALSTSGTLVTGSARSQGSRRTTSSTRTTSARTGGIGAGLVDMPPAPPVDPAKVVAAEATVSMDKRFCSNCGAPVGRARPDAPNGRTVGVCSQCRHRFDFEPKLHARDVVGGQYEVVGALAHGGLGWIYLAKDKAVNDRWVVLKGLLDAGDEAAMRVAVAERQFLAELSHPNIVDIYNFVSERGSGYIVEEYVGGKSLKQMLNERRAAHGGKPDPMPPAQALAFMLAILPAFGYLHGRGLLYCDFKPDNLIQVGDQVKLIDLGAVRRFDDHSSDVYGTVGYQAPEIADMGPSVASDVYTIGRTLAVLTLDFKGFLRQFATSLPDPADHPVLARFDSFHRLLLKATAPHPDDRFQTVGEFGEQALGVLREVVALETGASQPAPSSVFAPAPDGDSVPWLAIDAADAAASFLSNLPSDDPVRALAELRDALEHQAVPETTEVRLRFARALIEVGGVVEASAQLDLVEKENPWEWRAVWLRGILALKGSDLAAAARAFERCRNEVPGEPAPRFAAAIAFERADNLAAAAALYEAVVTTDPSYIGAARGLARCKAGSGDVAGAVAALDRIPATHRAHADAQVTAIRTLIHAGEFDDAARRLGQSPNLDVEAELYEGALAAVQSGKLLEKSSDRLAGRPVTERSLRLGLEDALRRQARLTSDPAERLKLVDRANRVRPFTVL
jgi:serine/threonine-protein kinase PknG